MSAQDYPWLNTYPKSVNWEMGPVEKPVHSIFEDTATTHPDAACLDFLGNKFTYGEILDQMHRFATALQKMGIKKGDRVGLCLPNTPYYVVAYYGAMKTGATVVNFNPLYTEKEIRQQVEDSAITIMVTLDVKPIYEKVAKCLGETTLQKIIHCPLASALPSLKRILFKLFKSKELASIPKDVHHIPFKNMLSQGKEFQDVEINPNCC